FILNRENQASTEAIVTATAPFASDCQTGRDQLIGGHFASGHVFMELVPRFGRVAELEALGRRAVDATPYKDLPARLPDLRVPQNVSEPVGGAVVQPQQP